MGTGSAIKLVYPRIFLFLLFGFTRDINFSRFYANEKDGAVYFSFHFSSNVF